MAQNTGKGLSDAPSRLVPRSDIALLLVLGFVATLPLAARLPVGGSLVVPGQITVGPAVVTLSDIYLGTLTIGLVVYARQVGIPRSSVILILVSFLAVLTISTLVNGVDAAAVVEVIQWGEMVVLAILLGLLLRNEWQRRRVLWGLVYIGVARAIWTIIYFALYGYPGRRFDVFIEGAALILLIGLVIGEKSRIRDFLAFVPLVTAVLIGQERKIWVGIALASAAVFSLYVIKHRNDSVALRRFMLASVLGSVLFVAAVLMLAPQEIVSRIYTLLALVPGVGGRTQFERAFLFETGIQMVKHNPLFGVGPENWFQAKETYATDQLVAFERSTGSDLGPHSPLIKVLAETGVFGFGLFALIFVRPLRYFGWYLRSDHRKNSLYLVIFGLFTYVFLVAMTRSGGFVLRGYLFITLGFLLSYEVYNNKHQMDRDPDTESLR